MSTTFNGTERKILGVISTLAEPVSRTAILRAAGISDGSNVTKALARLEEAHLVASSRAGRGVLYAPVPADEAEAANFAAGEAEDAAAWDADEPYEVAAEFLADHAVMEGDTETYDLVAGVEPDPQEADDPSPDGEDAPEADADMSPRTLAEEIADDLMSEKNGQVVQAIHRVAGLSPEGRAAVRARIIERMPAGEARTTLIATAGLVPTGDECRAAIAEGRKKRAAKGARVPKEKRFVNTTERYIVNTLAHFRTAMTRKDIDQACKLRGGSIAGHAVKRAYADLVERDILARTGDGETERFQITDGGYTQYVATLDGAPVELIIVPRWVPPAKRESAVA